MVEVK